MKLAEVLFTGTVKAAACIIAEKELTIGTDQVVSAVKKQVIAQYPEVLQSLKDAHSAHMGEPMLRQILNVACNKIAVDALNDCGALTAK
jgi:molybdopterin converting factor small subunit